MIFIVLGIVAVAVLALQVSPAVQAAAAGSIARAIGVAEGGYDAEGNNLNNGTLPSVNHNPGDLTVDTTGTGVGKNGAFIVYGSDADGFAALQAQITLWLTGGSAHADASSSIADISQFYTTPGASGNDQTNWANNVSTQLGVSSDTSIGDIGGS